jgi:hypothetical protein
MTEPVSSPMGAGVCRRHCAPTATFGTGAIVSRVALAAVLSAAVETALRARSNDVRLRLLREPLLSNSVEPTQSHGSPV